MKLSTDGESSSLEARERVGRAVGTTVDGVNHSSATMTGGSVGSLVAEDPNGLGLGW